MSHKNFEEKDVRDPDNATFGSFLAVFASFWPIERQIWISKGCPLDNYCYSGQKEAISVISLKKPSKDLFVYWAEPLSGRFWPFLAVFASFWPLERQIWVSKGCLLDNYCYSAQKEAIRAISLKNSQKNIFFVLSGAVLPIQTKKRWLWGPERHPPEHFFQKFKVVHS